jgi:hypothetical protein
VVRLGPPDAGVVPNEPVACPRSLGTVVGLFSAGHPGRFGACSAERMATIDALTGRVTVGLHAFADGINRVLPLARGGKRLSYAVVTDAGALWLVDAELKEARPVQLPGGSVEVVGVYPDGAGGLLAWTSRGSLFAVGREPSVRKYPTADVCLAFADAEIPDRLSVIRWVAERGLQIVPLRSDMER